MKKLLVLLIALTIMSCSKDEQCDCEKSSYTVEQYTYFDANWLPRMAFRTLTDGIVTIDCQDEGRTDTGSNSYYVISCH